MHETKQNKTMVAKQKERLLQLMQEGYTVNRINAMRELGIVELSARICELEKDGHEFTKDWIQQTNRFGENYKLRTYKR